MWKYGWIVLLFPSVASSADDAAIRQSIESGLWRLETAARNYTTNRKCFSCHHQAVPVFALAAASEKGFKIDSQILEEQFDFTLATFEPLLKQASEGKGIGGGNTMINYGLETLLTAGKPTEDVVTAMRKYLFVRQKPDGSWPAITPRPPSEGSKFTNAYFALKNLKGVAGEAEGAFKRGSEWVLGAEADTMEDRVFHLRALKLITAPEDRIRKARQAILPFQKEDGSWPQLKDMDGDAYATGTALVALRESGLPADDPAVRKGIDYLVKTQDSSGAWVVKTRSRPVQTYFDNGDPGGKSQFITIAATGWSVLALLDAIEKR
jgi:N-acyl-D-amino-acid deacylase